MNSFRISTRWIFQLMITIILLVHTASTLRYLYTGSTRIRTFRTFKTTKATTTAAEFSERAEKAVGDGTTPNVQKKQNITPLSMVMGGILVACLTGLAVGLTVQYARYRRSRGSGSAARPMEEVQLQQQEGERNEEKPKFTGVMSIHECTLPNNIESLTSNDLPYKNTPMGKVYSDLITVEPTEEAPFSELVRMKDLYDQPPIDPKHLAPPAADLEDPVKYPTSPEGSVTEDPMLPKSHLSD